MSSTITTSAAERGLMDHGHLLEKEGDARLKFDRACQQIALLDQKIRDLEVRYKRAVKHKKNSFRYNLRLRLSVVTGVKMMYHHYASTKAEELSRIRRQISSTSQNSELSRESHSRTREQRSSSAAASHAELDIDC
ncbi:hypothetical protein KP79_PYT04058 [Mizuhopecten yessoensis]|uniref:Uncharacterized protein n=1 Tax=Mizuhopecten yessoensis TaxID=6573 RepID=A0A210QUZ7_MIZYE|nr:hypothetical protein KP79_PYT04058 [Mizuhopecten yessoensis]